RELVHLQPGIGSGDRRALADFPGGNQVALPDIAVPEIHDPAAPVVGLLGAGHLHSRHLGAGIHGAGGSGLLPDVVNQAVHQGGGFQGGELEGILRAGHLLADNAPALVAGEGLLVVVVPQLQAVVGKPADVLVIRRLLDLLWHNRAQLADPDGIQVTACAAHVVAVDPGVLGGHSAHHLPPLRVVVGAGVVPACAAATVVAFSRSLSELNWTAPRLASTFARRGSTETVSPGLTALPLIS